MKIKTIRVWVLIIVVLIINFYQEFNWIAWGWFWGLVLGWSYKNQENHLVYNLLILEILSLINLFVVIIRTRYSGLFILIFILMRLIVREAVLGLAILVKTLRSNSKELKLGFLI